MFHRLRGDRSFSIFTATIGTCHLYHTVGCTPGPPGIPASAKLHVLFTGQHVSGVVQALDVVHDYIADLGKMEVGIIVYTVVSNIDTTNS